MKKKKINRIKQFLYTLGILAIGTVAFLNNSFGVYESIASLFSSNPIEPFSEKGDNFRILVFPFKNYSTKTDSNLSEAIFEKINQIKISNELNNLEIKYYPLLVMDINEAKLREIAKKMNADLIIWGSYELSSNCNSSICLMNFSVLNTKQGITRTEKLPFESVINSVESGKLTEPVEFYIYYVLGVLEYENGGQISRSFSLLDKAWKIAKNGRIKKFVKEVRDQAALHMIVFDNVSPDLTSQEAGLKFDSPEYGLSSSSPVFLNGWANQSYYLKHLRYRGMPLEYKEIELLIIDSLSPLNNEVLLDRFAMSQNNRVIDTLYIYLYSRKNFFKPPKGYTFAPEHLEAKEILYGTE